MSERTTIGGTVYEAIGSSSSNLLLRCNGTARIQWGGRLIDLIKNGKIASSDSKELIFIVSDESEIKSDGIYILTTEESSKLLVCKDGNTYDFTDANIYISASKEQNLTVDQKKQALENIGIQYNTLTELQSAGIKNGLAYVCDTATLYTVKNGDIKEFEATLKTVTVEKEETGEGMNSSEKIVLSILDDEYLILADQRIIANYSIYVKDSAQLGSESADKTKGYRLYIEGDTSYLDVDEINVRHGIKNTYYKEILFEELSRKLSEKSLEPLQWYLIKDFQNHWRLIANDNNNNRPILVRALTNDSLHEDGFLFENPKIRIKYDPSYTEEIKQLTEEGEISINSRGKITWMKDQYNNESGFDFLDYYDYKGNALTTLHDGSIFPKDSYNNKLKIYNLKGISIDGDHRIKEENTDTVDFKESITNMHDNVLDCKNLSVDCANFYNNMLTDVFVLDIKADMCDNIITDVNNITVNHAISKCTITSLTESTVNAPLSNCIFGNIVRCTFNSSFTNVSFKNLTDCIFDEGNIENVTSYYDLSSETFSETTNRLLFNTSKRKEIYINSDKIQIICAPDVIFYRGMIIMHSGLEEIPPGWAICDGGEYEFNGIKTTTPNLINKFIKAVATVEEIKESEVNSDLNEDGKLVLRQEHLPEHSHPHNEHEHTLNNLSISIDPTTVEVTSDTTYAYTQDVVEVTADEENGTSVTYLGDYSSSNWSLVRSSEREGHTHNITVSGGEISKATSTEQAWQYGDAAPINIEPKHYSLIFIMKL